MCIIRALTIAVLLLLAAGCGPSRHATRAHLYEVDDSAADQRRLNRPRDPHTAAQYAQNVVFVSNDSKFSLELVRANPGLLQRKSAGEAARDSAELHTRGISREARDNLLDKELWLLTHIESLNPEDPLELRGKRYFKSSVLHLDAMEQSLIPFDEAESVLFTHESDTSYRVSIRIFEVDRVRLKRELALAAQDPGLIEVVEAGAQTVVGTLGAALGPTVSNVFRRYRDEPLAMERLLLSSGAVEEFNGRFVIVRRGSYADNSELTATLERHFALVDLYKGENLDQAKRSQEIESLRSEQLCMLNGSIRGTGLHRASDAACPTNLGSFGFVEIKLAEIPNPAQAGSSGALVLTATEAQAKRDARKSDLAERIVGFVGDEVWRESAIAVAQRKCHEVHGDNPRVEARCKLDIADLADRLQASVKQYQELKASTTAQAAAGNPAQPAANGAAKPAGANATTPASAATASSNQATREALQKSQARVRLEVLQLARRLLASADFSEHSCLANSELDNIVATAKTEANDGVGKDQYDKAHFCQHLGRIDSTGRQLQDMETLIALIQRPND